MSDPESEKNAPVQHEEAGQEPVASGILPGRGDSAEMQFSNKSEVSPKHETVRNVGNNNVSETGENIDAGVKNTAPICGISREPDPAIFSYDVQCRGNHGCFPVDMSATNDIRIQQLHTALLSIRLELVEACVHLQLIDWRLQQHAQVLQARLAVRDDTGNDSSGKGNNPDGNEPDNGLRKT